MVLKLAKIWFSRLAQARRITSIIVVAWATGAAFAQPLTGPRLEVATQRYWRPDQVIYVNDHLKCLMGLYESKGDWSRIVSDISLRAGEKETPLLAWCSPAMQSVGETAQLPRAEGKAGGFVITLAPIPSAKSDLPAVWKTKGAMLFDSNAADFGVREEIAVTQACTDEVSCLRLATHPAAPVTDIRVFNGEVTRPELPEKETLNEPGTALALIGPQGITVVSLDRQATSPELLVEPPRIIVRPANGQRSCFWTFHVTTQGKQAFHAEWRVRLLPADTPEEELGRILSPQNGGERK